MLQNNYYYTIIKQHLTTIIFIGGFAIDMFFLPPIDHPFSKWIGLIYITIIALSIYLREKIIARNKASKHEQRAFSFLTLCISYCSGSALSFVFIYAARSAALSVSWPLLFIILGIMVINEMVSSHSFRFTLDIGILFFVLTFYSIFTIPIIVNQQSDIIFAISIASAGLLALAYTLHIHRASETTEHESGRSRALSLGIPVFIAMLYYVNVLPAVPLSLLEGNVYHNITRTSEGDFVGVKEDIPTRTIAGYSLGENMYHLREGETSVYYFSSVYAPATLSVQLSHKWEYYDTSSKTWRHYATIPFTVKGARVTGYRAYSTISNAFPGKWRVTTLLGGKRTVGRTTFTVVEGDYSTKTSNL